MAVSSRQIGKRIISELVKNACLKSGWKQIESAPRDGTQIWGFEKERGTNPMIWTDANEWVITYNDASANPSAWMEIPFPPDGELAVARWNTRQGTKDAALDYVRDTINKLNETR